MNSLPPIFLETISYPLHSIQIFNTTLSPSLTLSLTPSYFAHFTSRCNQNYLFFLNLPVYSRTLPLHLPAHPVLSINCLLSTRSFPLAYKQAIISPILKTEQTNKKPSMTPATSSCAYSVMCTIASACLYFLTSCSLFNLCQLDLHPQTSTKIAPVKVNNGFYLVKSNGSFSVFILCNISKVFPS